MTKIINKRERRRFQKRELPIHLMLIPSIVAVFIFSYIPLGGNVIAFQRFETAKELFGEMQ